CACASGLHGGNNDEQPSSNARSARRVMTDSKRANPQRHRPRETRSDERNGGDVQDRGGAREGNAGGRFFGQTAAAALGTSGAARGTTAGMTGAAATCASLSSALTA